MDDANEEAAEIIEEESDADEAAEEVEEVMDEAADEIKEVNEDHDEKVSAIAKTTFVAEITNDTVKDKILRDIVDAAEDGFDVNDVIAEQHLPFNVQTPSIVDDDEPAEEKIKRIVCRNGDCVGDIKRDPEFDSFLESVLGKFGGFDVQRPGRPDIKVGPEDRPERPDGEIPERPEIERPDRPEVPERDERPELKRERPERPDRPERDSDERPELKRERPERPEISRERPDRPELTRERPDRPELSRERPDRPELSRERPGRPTM